MPDLKIRAQDFTKNLPKPETVYQETLTLIVYLSREFVTRVWCLRCEATGQIARNIGRAEYLAAKIAQTQAQQSKGAA